MTVLLNPCYFGSISYWLGIVESNHQVFEIWDNYQKQSFRNRCNILAANGKLSLTIPVRYTQKNRQLYKDVRIANDINWKEQHMKSLASAYLMSPYYEFYIDDLKSLYKNDWTFLMDFNFESLRIISQCLDIDLNTSKTSEFISDEKGLIDYRHLTSKKSVSPYNIKPYTQVFSEKFGFIEDLSVLDLLFNEGPNSENYLIKQLRN